MCKDCGRRAKPAKNATSGTAPTVRRIFVNSAKPSKSIEADFRSVSQMRDLQAVHVQLDQEFMSRDEVLASLVALSVPQEKVIFT